MEFSPKQQVIELIKKSQRILLVGRSNPGGDSIGSALAFFEVLKELNKEVEVVFSDNIPDEFNFLPNIKEIKNNLEGGRDFVIKVNVKSKPVEKLSYDILDDFLNIVISPKEEGFESSDVSFSKGSLKHDLIIALDVTSIDEIDKIYDDNAQLFFEVPVINIDHHAGNEHFGTINFIDVTATSTAEILVSLIEALGVKLTESISTALLTGIISDTGSFKKKNTTPKSLTVSAQLLAAGAKQQEIINNLYKKKPINTLKLWGKILSRLQHDKEYRLVWSTIPYNEFKTLDANLGGFEELIDEFLSNTPGADVILLLAEYELNKIMGYLFGQRGTDVLMIAEMFGGSGEFHNARFELSDMTIERAIEEITNKIKELQDKRAGMGKPDENKKVIIPLQKFDKGSLKGSRLEAIEDLEEIKRALEKEKDHQKKVVAKQKEETLNSLEGLIDKIGDKDKAEDAITEALRSLEKERSEREEMERSLNEVTKEKDKGESIISLGDVLKGKYKNGKPLDDSIFWDKNEDEILDSATEIVKDDDGGDIEVWRADD